MKPKQILFIIMLLLTQISLLFTQSSFAEETEPSPINAIPLPVGSGARALGMGGAFIAVADDATAASWNPGGLTQLERPELSVVGSFLSMHQDFNPGSTGLLSLNDEGAYTTDLNYASVAYPFKVFGKNLVASLNYQQKYDFHDEIDFRKTIEDPDIEFFDETSTDFKSRGGIAALTPAIAMQVMPKLSIGVAVNIYTDEYFGDFAWRGTTRKRTTETLYDTTTVFASDEDVTFKNFQAVNVTVGMLLDVWEKEEKRLTFGAVFHSPYTADVDRIIDLVSSENGTINPPVHIREHFEIDFPMSFGGGFGFRYSDALSFSMDVTWTDWSEFEQENEESGRESLPIGGITKPTDKEIDDTYAVRFGTEYLIFRQKMIIPVRGGLFFEPRPSLDDPTDVYGVSVGSGITFKRFSIDGAYQFRWANDGEGEDFGGALNGTTFDLNEHLFLASVIVYF